MCICKVSGDIERIILNTGSVVVTDKKYSPSEGQQMFHYLPQGVSSVLLREPNNLLVNCNKCIQVENRQTCGNCCRGEKSDCEHSSKCPNNCKEGDPLQCSKLIGVCCREQ